MMTRLLSCAAVCVALVSITPAAMAQQGAEEDNPVLATVDGDAIRRSDVMEAVQALPPQYQAQLAQVFPLLLAQLVDLKLVTHAAAAAGLDDDEEVQRRLDEQRQNIMRDVYIERYVDEQVSDQKLQDQYQQFIADNPPPTEVNARHILVETEDQARDVIAKLDEGGEFAELAKEHSTGPSSAQGGDLGYFTEQDMVPEFSEAAFALEKGSHSKDPVQTQFGWHVIKIEDRRAQEPPSFEEMREQMHGEAARAVIEELVAGLREGAEIEILGQGTGASSEAAPESGSTSE